MSDRLTAALPTNGLVSTLVEIAVKHARNEDVGCPEMASEFAACLTAALLDPSEEVVEAAIVGWLAAAEIKGGRDDRTLMRAALRAAAMKITGMEE